eukprot:SAG22_NODE_4546_length_1238_cov_2.091308_1_plen_283_part_00
MALNWPMFVALALLSQPLVALVGAAPAGFLLPQSDTWAVGTWVAANASGAGGLGLWLGPPPTTAAECAARCLKLEAATEPRQEIVSINVCPAAAGGNNSSPDSSGAAAGLDCHCSTWGVRFELQSKTGCAWYRRSLPRNDSRAVPKVAIQAAVPAFGVALAKPVPGGGSGGNLLSQAFLANIEYLRLRSDVDAMLYRFRLRKSAPCHQPKPKGYCYGWDCSLAPDYAASGDAPPALAFPLPAVPCGSSVGPCGSTALTEAHRCLQASSWARRPRCGGWRMPG